MLSVTFCGAARTVTGSQYYLEYVAPDGTKFNFCLDSGMFQVGQRANLYRINSHLIFDPKKLDAIVLTHAHLDHCGRIPYLVKQGFGGRIYSTEATKQIAEIVMMDSARMNTDENEDPAKLEEVLPDVTLPQATKIPNFETKVKKENLDLYGEAEVMQAMTRFKTYDYHEPFLIHSNLQVEFFDAGHILGSAFVVITEISTGRKIVFSGDLGNVNKPIIEDPEMPPSLSNISHIFVETTYGNKLHGKLDPKDKLRRVIRQTLKQNGKLLIPAFSVERAQEVIYYIVELMREGRIPNVPIYLDSPMASKVLRVCLDHPELYDEEMREKVSKKANPLIYKHLKVLETVQESKTLNGQHKPCIIIAGSGMMTGGRILKHLQFNIENPQNMILMVGYQAEGTLGREILEGATEVEIEQRMFYVRAGVEIINEFSAHADKQVLKRWVASLVKNNTDRGKTNETTVFLMHGEKNASLGFGDELNRTLINTVKSYWPRFGEKIQLW